MDSYMEGNTCFAKPWPVTMIGKLRKTLETERLVLEPIARRHASLLFSSLRESAIYEWISTSPPTSISILEKHWSGLSRQGRNIEGMFLGQWAVRRRSDDIFVAKLDVDIDRDNTASNIGYIVFPAFWRCGLATEAVICLSDHLARIGIRNQRALVTEGNIASSRVLEKAGFIYKRTIVGNDILRGLPVNDLEYLREG